jgi:hypothetical protein
MSPRGYGANNTRRGRNVEKKWTKSVVIVLAAVIATVLVLAALAPLL